ncbi:hypothetical protein [Mesorhizobium sp. M0040]|uniref:hypothetical protein n=1 Tax=Mesorhizobium sp. M0040 TaxID=2956855 RepID=UPI0033380985
MSEYDEGLSRIIGDLALKLASSQRAAADYNSDNVSRESYGAQLSDERAIKVVHNYATRPKPGHIIFTMQYDNTCYQLNPSSGVIEFLFEVRQLRKPFLWRAVSDGRGILYASVGGGRFRHGPYDYAVMDRWGGIFSIDFRSQAVKIISVGQHLLMPCFVDILDEDNLLCCGTSDFNSSGAVYSINVRSGAQRFVYSHPRLRDPVSASYDESGDLWIANSDQNTQDGELIRVSPNGEVKAVVPFSGTNTGAVCGVCIPRNDEGVVITKMNWPYMIGGLIAQVSRAGGEIEPIMSSTGESPKFFSTGCAVEGDDVWFAENYSKRIIRYNLKKKNVVREYDVSSLLGGNYQGMRNSYMCVENLSVVPDLR